MAIVLVAEDDRLLSMLVAAALQGANHLACCAYDGIEAARLLRAPDACFDIALIDLVMPGMDGAVLLEICRREFPAMPVILTSGYARDFVSRRLGNLEADAFLAKPWRVETLVDCVNGVLKDRDAGKPAAEKVVPH